MWSAVGYGTFVLGLLLLSLFFVIAGPAPTRKLICCGPSNNLQQKISKLVIDLTYCILVPWARSQGHNQPFLNFEKKKRGPTLHPHHIITHNTQHQILNVYNKTTIIRRGSLHGETSAMFVTTCGPFGNSFSPLKR